MRSLGLQGIRRSKGIRTTIPAKDGKRADDLLDRDFTAEAPNRTWVMAFAYVRTWVGFVYVAFILDAFAQKIVAWNVAPTKAVELVNVPLRMALWQRNREGHPVVRGELIGHADARSQYTSITFTDHLAGQGIRPSMIGCRCLRQRADGVRNRPLQDRVRPHHGLPRRPLPDHRRRPVATAGRIDWYSNRRLHTSLGMMTPVKFEQAHYATLNRESQLVLERRRTWRASPKPRTTPSTAETRSSL